MQPWRRLRARWRSLPPLIVDALLALVFLASDVGSVLVTQDGALRLVGLGDFDATPGVAVPVATLAALPLVWRRRAPVAVLATSAAVIAVGLVLAVPPSANATLFALFTVAAHRPRRTSTIALAVLAVATFAGLVGPAGLGLATAQLFGLAGVWALGDRLAVQRAYVAELEQRAVRAERDRETRARVAVGEERARIARELHDVVAHSVSVMVVQASAARRTFRTRPADADEALGQIETIGRRSLGEMRRLLVLLRTDGEQLPFSPQPGLSDVPRLVGDFCDAGLPVRLTVSGTPRVLPPGPDLSAYRIVQEGLTNALQHAQATRVLVTVRYGPGEVVVEIVDDGRGAGAEQLERGPGHGLVGMRERTALVGGVIEAGPRPGGGFRVMARLPTGTGAG